MTDPTPTGVPRRRRLARTWKLAVLMLAIAGTSAVTLLIVDLRRDADAAEGVRSCHRAVLREAAGKQAAAAGATGIQFLGEEYVVGEDQDGRSAIAVNGWISVAGVEATYSCEVTLIDGGRLGSLVVRWPSAEADSSS